MLPKMTRSGLALCAGSVLMLAGLATPAVAGTVYSWQTEEGTYAFTDDAKRVPEKYKAQAKKRELQKLEDYERLTPGFDFSSEPGYTDALERRLAVLEQRARDERRAAYAHSAAGGGPGGAMVELQLGPLRIPLNAAAQSGADPFVIEEVIVRDDHYNANKTVQYVRQGDEIIAAYNPPFGDEYEEVPTRDVIDQLRKQHRRRR
jgi:hypothetical protein